MQEYGRYLHLFCDNKPSPKFAVIKRDSMGEDRVIIQSTSAYNFYRLSDLKKNIMIQVFKQQVDSQKESESTINQLDITDHPCIKLPLFFSHDSSDKPFSIHYSLTEKGTLQSVFNYYQDLQSNPNARFNWDFNMPQNSENSDKNAHFSLSAEQKFQILIGIASACLQLEKSGNCIKSLLPSFILLDENFKPHLINTSFPLLKNNGYQTDSIFISPKIEKEKCCESLAYSFGYIAYFLLAERQPFYYVDLSTALRKMELGQVPMFPGSLPSSLFTLLTECCDISQFRRPSFETILCVLYNILHTPTYVAYANEVVPSYIIASARAARLGESSKIFKILMDTTDETAPDHLMKCSKIASKFPISDPVLSVELMKVSARTSFVHARRALFLMLIKGFALETNMNKNRAFQLVKQWAEEGDMESAVLLAHCYEKGIGCGINPEKANQTIRSAKSPKLFSATYEFGRFTIDGIGAEKETSSGEALQKEAFNDHKDNEIYSYLEFLRLSPFKAEPKIFDFLTTHELTKDHPELIDTLMRIMMTTTKKDGTAFSVQEIHNLAEKATEEGKYLDYLLQKRNRNLMGEKLPNEQKELPEVIIPASELTRRESNKLILQKIIKTRKLDEKENEKLQESTDKLIRAKALLCGAKRNIVLAEDLLEEISMENVEANIILLLLRMSIGMIPNSIALEKLNAFGDHPEAKNAMAYYYRHIENRPIEEVIALLDKAAEAGSIVAGLNYSCFVKNSKVTNPKMLDKALVYEKNFFEQSPAAFFGVFDAL